MTVKHWDVTKRGTESRERANGDGKMKSAKQNRDFETKLLRRLGLKLGFVPVPRARSLF